MPDRVPADRPTNPDFESIRNAGGTLARQLALYDLALRERSPATGKAYQDLVDRLKEMDSGSGAPASGDSLPPFLMPDENGRFVSSADLLAGGPVVVTFNRGNWCPYCWLELSALQACHAAIVDQGASVVSITPEVATYSRRLKNRLELTFPVLTDLDNGYALELGLAVSLTRDVCAVYDRAGIDLGTFQRNAMWFLPIPATFVVDRHGIVRHAYVNADFRERIDPSELPALLAGF